MGPSGQGVSPTGSSIPGALDVDSGVGCAVGAEGCTGCGVDVGVDVDDGVGGGGGDDVGCGVGAGVGGGVSCGAGMGLGPVVGVASSSAWVGSLLVSGVVAG